MYTPSSPLRLYPNFNCTVLQDDVKMEINKHFLRMSEEARENIFQSLLELLKYDNLVRLFVSYCTFN